MYGFRGPWTRRTGTAYPAPVRSFVTHLSCSRCEEVYEAGEEHHVCEACGSPLLVHYDLDGVGAAVRPSDLRERPPTMWRYRELLPLRDDANLVSMGEGFTPLVRVDSLGRRLGLTDLWIKDDGQNPTGSFKARGASAGLSMARELGVREVSMPSSGNAGGAWATYGALAGLTVHVTVPNITPALCRAEVLLHGGDLIIEGDTLPESVAAAAKHVDTDGWYDAATWREPYRLDGKRPMGYELAEQLGWSMPDVVVYPTGGGIGVLAIQRGLTELRELGWITGDLPRMIAVQAEGCAPLVKALEEGADDTEVWPEVRTIASGMRVPKSLGHFLVLATIRETGGTAVTVSDPEMLDAMVETASATGILPCPEGASTIAALPKLIEMGAVSPDERIVAYNTGSGLRYPEAMTAATGQS